MRLKGISKQGLSRIAKSVKGQEEDVGTGMEYEQSQLGHQYLHSSPDRAFGLLQLADIPLVESQITTGGQKYFAPDMFIGVDLLGEHIRSRIDTTARFDQVCLTKNVDGAEQAGTGQADGGFIRDRGQVEIPILKFKVSDGPVNGARATGDIDPFESRTGSGGGGQNAVAIGDHDFAVGAQVDGGHGGGGAVEIEIGQAGQRVGTDETTD